MSLCILDPLDMYLSYHLNNNTLHFWTCKLLTSQHLFIWQGWPSHLLFLYSYMISLFMPTLYDLLVTFKIEGFFFCYFIIVLFPVLSEFFFFFSFSFWKITTCTVDYQLPPCLFKWIMHALVWEANVDSNFCFCFLTSKEHNLSEWSVPQMGVPLKNYKNTRIRSKKLMMEVHEANADSWLPIISWY